MFGIDWPFVYTDICAANSMAYVIQGFDNYCNICALIFLQLSSDHLPGQLLRSVAGWLPLD